MNDPIFQLEADQWFEKGYKMRGEEVFYYEDDRHEQQYSEDSHGHYLEFLKTTTNEDVKNWIKSIHPIN
jgi:hypothetical protein